MRGYESTNLSSDVDSIGGNVLNREHGLESEVEMDKVGEGQERNEEGVGITVLALPHYDTHDVSVITDIPYMVVSLRMCYCMFSSP